MRSAGAELQGRPNGIAEGIVGCRLLDGLGHPVVQPRDRPRGEQQHRRGVGQIEEHRGLHSERQRKQRRGAAPTPTILTPEIIDECLRGAAETVKDVERQLENSFLLPLSALSLRIQSRSKL